MNNNFLLIFYKNLSTSQKYTRNDSFSYGLTEPHAQDETFHPENVSASFSCYYISTMNNNFLLIFYKNLSTSQKYTRDEG